MSREFIFRIEETGLADEEGECLFSRKMYRRRDRKMRRMYVSD